MGRWFLLVCICALLSCDAMADLAFDWARVIHIKPIRFAMLADTLGVSNDKRTVVVWHAASGLPIATWNDIGGDVQQTWITRDLKSVVAVVNRIGPNATSQVTLYWLNLSSLRVVDSMALPTVETPDTNALGFAAHSDLSEDGTRLAVVLYQPVDIDDSGTVTLHVVDLASRNIVLTESRGPNSRVQFETGGTYITTYLPNGYNNIRHSPSGYYTWKYGQISNGEYRVAYGGGMTRENWEPVRWSVTDAVMLGRELLLSKKYGPLRLVNICRDDVIATIATAPYDQHGFWATPDMKRVVGFASSGQVVVWRLPDITHYDSLCISTPLPDTVMTDTVCDVKAYWYPGSSSRNYLIDRGDGSIPVNTQYMSWNEPGEHLIRFGREHNGYVSWTPPRQVFVKARKPADKIAPFLRTNFGTYRIHTTKDNRIIVSGSAFYEVDNNLRCNRAYEPVIALGEYGTPAAWFDDSTLVLQYGTSTAEPVNGQWVGGTSSGFVKFSLVDFTFGDHVVTETLSFKSKYSFCQSIDIVDRAPSDEFWFMNQSVTPDSGTKVLKVLKEFSITGRAERCLSDKANYFLQTFTAASTVNSSSTHAVFIPSKFCSPIGRRKDVLIADLQTGLCEALPSVRHISDYYYAMFMNDEVAISDSLMIRVKPFYAVKPGFFSGPFARSIPEGHAIAWRNGEFHRIDSSGNVIGSAPGPGLRPKIIRSLPDGRLLIGTAEGIQIYGSPTVSIDDDFVHATTGGLSVSPQPAASTLRVRISQKQAETMTTIVLSDITGRTLGEWQMPSASEYTINLSTALAANGMHVLYVRNGSIVSAALVCLSR